jgi:hypothetical protein
MSSKTANKKGTKAVTATEPEKEEVVIESVKEEPIVVPEEETLSITNDDNNEEDDEINSEEIVSSEKYIDIIKQKNLLIQEEVKALGSISTYTKAELMKIEKEELINAKAKFDLEKKRIKEKYSRLKKNAPKAKKEIKLDADGNKIPVEGKSPVVWYDFAKDAFGLKINNGFGNHFLGYIWAFLKSEVGVKDGSSIIISNPGKVNTFFQKIKEVIEKRGLNSEKEKAVHALIEKGVLSNHDITRFSTYCYEEKIKKPKSSKKAKAEAEAK